MPRVDIVLIALSKPILVGIYVNSKLIEQIRSEEYTSDILAVIFDDILNRFYVESIYFAKGPGSFMSIKLVYIFLKSLQIAKDINLFATDGFYFNSNTPIKAIKNSYFIKRDGIINIEKLNCQIEDFELPDTLKKEDFSEDIEPLYILPAI
jgi:tRNA A37 threonylcarbamoyladenosine modification protein TsaB